MVQTSSCSVVPFIEKSSIYCTMYLEGTHRKVVIMLDWRRAVSGRQVGSFFLNIVLYFGILNHVRGLRDGLEILNNICSRYWVGQKLIVFFCKMLVINLSGTFGQPNT